MNKETFKAEITKVCASALANGVIDLGQFNKYIEMSNLSQTVRVSQSSQRPAIKRNRYTTVKWSSEMFQLAVTMVLDNKSYAEVAQEFLRRFGKKVTDKSVGTMLYKVRSGKIFDSAKYRKEPLYSLMMNLKHSLKAVAFSQDVLI